MNLRNAIIKSVRRPNRLRSSASTAFREWAVLPLALCWISTSTTADIASQNWRLFKTSDAIHDSFATGLTLSPRNNVWVKRGAFAAISRLDGYSITNFPSPGISNFRIYESKSGQVWSAYEGGLAALQGGQWLYYPVPEIAAQIESDISRRLQILPAQRDQVLYLLPQRLMLFEANERGSTRILETADTPLDRFNDIHETRRGDLWIAGDSGLIRFRNPVRTVKHDAQFDKVVWPESFQAKEARRLVEDSQGGLTMIAESRFGKERFLLHWQDGKWDAVRLGNILLNAAWHEEDGQYWGITSKSLYRIRHGSIEEVETGQYFDVANGPDAGFWLATYEGVRRYARQLWRPPDHMPSTGSKTPAIVERRSGVLWFASEAGLMRMEENEWRIIPWPSYFSPSFASNAKMVESPSGGLLVSHEGGAVLYHIDADRFSPFRHSEEKRIHGVLGVLNNGNVCLWTTQKTGQGESDWIEIYDGNGFEPWISFEELAPLGNQAFFVKEAAPGQIWIGGTIGLAILSDGQFTFHDYSTGFKADRAFCVADVGGGRYWIGSRGILMEFDRKQWREKRRDLGRINHILKSKDQSVWLATNRGAWRWQNDAWVHYGKSEGLEHDRVYRILEDHFGRIWAATGSGPRLYHLQADTSPPQLVSAQANGAAPKTVRQEIQIELEGRDRWDFTLPDRLLYSTRLNDAPWSPFSTNRFFEFQELPAGNHVIEARAMDRNWNVSKSPWRLEFLSVIPWYREPRIVGVAVTGILAALFFAVLAVHQHWKLKLSYARVENEVRERTRQLEKANEKLLHSQKMTAMGTLAAGVAHDFNSILSIIKGSAQLIESHLNDPPRVQTRVERIKMVVDQGSRLVKAMLGLSRATSQGLVDCDLVQIARDTATNIEDRLERRVQIEVAVHNPVPPVQTAKELVQQTLTNLLINAADAMNENGVIRMRVGSVPSLPSDLVLTPLPDKVYHFISIQDEGCGISEENLKRVFEPFFSTKAFSSRRGTGLGLSMVYEFAKEMRLGLQAQSRLGEGSCFTLYFPSANHILKET